MEKKTNTPKLYLIDGNSLLYKAFFALPDTMKTSTGLTTNAIYGFSSMLMRLLDDKPEYIAVAFDMHAPTFRHKKFEGYKAKRHKIPETLKEQLPYSRELLRDLNIPIFEIEGFEADDIIATIAKKAEIHDLETIIVTADKDAYQLVSDKTKVLATLKGISHTTLLDKKGVLDKLGVSPEHVADYKSLAGDASDNIPGVPGIGEKTAVALISKFGSLEDILDNINNIENAKLREKLEKNIESAKLSKYLALLIENVPIEFNFTQLKRKEIDWDKLIPLYKKFEFHSLIRKYAEGEAAQVLKKISDEKVHSNDPDLNYCLIRDIDKLAEVLKELENCKAFAFDTETTSLNTIDAELLGISFCFKKNHAFYIPYSVLKGEKHLEILKSIFKNNEIEKYGHNIKYDVEVLYGHGIEIQGIAYDTMIAAFIADPDSTSLGLKFLASKYLHKTMTTFDDLLTSDKIKNLKNAPLEDVSKYACADADSTFALVEILSKELKSKDVENIFYNVEMPLVKVLCEMELNGVSIDSPKLGEISKDIDKKIAHLETHIYSIAGEKFNINSPKQLAKIIFDKLQIPSTKKTKTGASTDASVLEALAPKFEIAQKLLEYRQLAKLKSTYVDVLPNLVNPKTQRIHTSYNQVATATGRLSSNNPNLQNIPVKGPMGQMIREAFIPRKHTDYILSADYSQVELRILAHLSKDQALIDDFVNDRDIHSSTAAEIYDVKLSEVTKEMRNSAKAINFGIIYGMSAFGLSKNLNIKKDEAQRYIDKYFAKYHEVKKYIECLIECAKDKGYVETILGRRRYLPNIHSKNFNEQMFAQRMAVNTPIQGSAADFIKMAMINIYDEMKKKNVKSKMIMQIHDELVFEVAHDELDEVKKMVSKLMACAIALDVPIKVDVGYGKSWGQAKE